jgi:hypothetical protein
MKKLSNLKGAKTLDKKEQKLISGGREVGGGCYKPYVISGGSPYATNGTPCFDGLCCGGKCVSEEYYSSHPECYTNP